MPFRLDVNDPSFPQDFQSLLGMKRETTAEVNDAVHAILEDVRLRGDAAVIDYTARFDRMTIDAERLAIAEKFGFHVKTVREHFSLSFHVPLASVSEMNQEMHAQGRGGFGPSTIESRYILEDVPFGLVATSALGRMAGVPATLHEAGTAIFSAAYGRDLAADNDLLPALGFASLDRKELERLCRDGYAG